MNCSEFHKSGIILKESKGFIILLSVVELLVLRMPKVCCCQSFPACLRNLKYLSFPGTDSKCILLEYKHKIRGSSRSEGQSGIVG